MSVDTRTTVISTKNGVETFYPARVTEARKLGHIKVKLDKGGHELVLNYKNDRYEVDFLGTIFHSDYEVTQDFRAEIRTRQESMPVRKSKSGLPPRLKGKVVTK